MRQRLREVADLLGVPRGDGIREHVRDVVVIASSSRGGSSMLAELLRKTPRLLHFRAEINPFFVLSELSHPCSGTNSDALNVHHSTLSQIAELDAFFAADVGNACEGSAAQERLASDVAIRLMLQWPHIDFNPREVVSIVREFGRIGTDGNSLQQFHVLLLEQLRERHPKLNAWYYDIAPQHIESLAPTLARPEGPPDSFVLEEPPFVTLRPWRLASRGDLGTRPLIIKTPSNVYRLEFLRALFPRARFRVLHLCRNPAASINGLVDGWQYRGFFSHRIEGKLGISGYQGAHAATWWKYDLPPGWESLRGHSLVDVCAFQWRSAHAATLAFLDLNPQHDVLRIRFEDLVGPPSKRLEAFERLTGWLGIEIDEPLEAAIRDGMPPVMATATPRQRRWFQKAAMIEPVLARPEIQEMAERLGYGQDPRTWE